MVGTSLLRLAAPRGRWFLLGAFAPFLLNALIVGYYSVDVPVGDEWVIALLLSRAVTGNLSLGDVLMQANESRNVIPRLVLMPLAFLTGWDVRYELVLAQALLAATGVLVLVTSRRTLRLPPVPTGILALATMMLLASPAQTQNMLWGIQVYVDVPGFCLMACGAIATARWRFQTKLIAQGLMSAVATYSYSNGMTLWAIVPLLWIREAWQVSRGARWGAVGGWILSGVVSLWLYFVDFSGADPSGNLQAILAQPTRALASLALLLGAPLSAGPTMTAQAAVGAIVLTLVALAALWHLRSIKDIDRALPWFALLVYGGLAAVLIVHGRFRFGMKYPMLADRYVAFTVYVYIAVLHLFVLASTHTAKTGRWLRRAAWAAVAVVGLLHGRVVLATVPRYADMRIDYLQSKAAVWLVRAVPLGNRLAMITYYYDDQRPVADIAANLSRAGLRHPPSIRSLRQATFAPSGSSAAGEIEIVSPVRPGHVDAKGWCFLPGRHEPCDAVVVTPAGRDGIDRPCSVLFPDQQRPEVVLKGRLWGPFDPGSVPRTGWSGEMSCDAPDGVDAWGVDIVHAELYRLARKR